MIGEGEEGEGGGGCRWQENSLEGSSAGALSGGSSRPSS